MSRHVATDSRHGALRGAGALALLLVIGGFVVADRIGGETGGETTTGDVEPGPDAAPLQAAQVVVEGSDIRAEPRPPAPTPEPTPTLPTLLPTSAGRVGSGLALGGLAPLSLPVSPTAPPAGQVTTAVANIPNRTGDAGFASSMRALAGATPDFMMLNEVSRHDTAAIEGVTPGYAAYRDEQADRSTGGTQSLNNVVLWRTGTWTLVEGGRVKVVDDDRGFRQGKAFTWDRYATWAVLQRIDGAIVSVISTHMPTNPGKYPRQHGSNRYTRAQQYAVGMDILIDTARTLAAYGPVLIGGDMNTHGREGTWTAAAKLGAAGFEHAKDRAVMYSFFPASGQLLSNREIRIASDHPAIVTSIDLS